MNTVQVGLRYLYGSKQDLKKSKGKPTKRDYSGFSKQEVMSHKKNDNCGYKNSGDVAKVYLQSEINVKLFTR